MNRKRNAKKPGLHRLLSARPFRNQAIEVLVRDENRLLLSVPIKPRWWNSRFVRWLVPMNRFRRIELDRRGMHFFDLCDGDRTVADIVATFAETYDLSALEARIAVAAFLGTLIEKGVVALVGTETPAVGRRQERPRNRSG
ncbi:MAG: PqqD family protein [Kiritimatiellaeota bacterium]|nr:PqqD family protein [Kiritimatiellota bacterium]